MKAVKKLKKKSFIILFLLIACSLAITQIGRINAEPNKDVEKVAKSFVKFSHTISIISDEEFSLLKNKNLKTSTLSELKSDKNCNLSKLVKKDNPLNKKYETLIDREMNEVADGNTRTFNSEAKNIKTTKSYVNGNIAHIDMNYTATASCGQLQGDKWVMAYPQNDVIAGYDLEKDSGGNWYIIKENWTFAPGREP